MDVEFGRHLEAWLIVQAVGWYLRYPLSYRDLDEMFRERGLTEDRTINEQSHLVSLCFGLQ